MDKKPKFKDSGAVFTLLFPIVYIILGSLLLFVDGINTKVLAELLGGLLIIFGAAFIIKYFLSRAYLDMRAYGFSLGMLACILGVCAIIRAEDVGNSLSVCLNMCIMLTAIVKLQNAIQLKFMKSALWLPILVISLVFLTCTILLALDPFDPTTRTRDIFTYVVLICDGIASFVNAILLRVISKRFGKEQAAGLQPV